MKLADFFLYFYINIFFYIVQVRRGIFSIKKHTNNTQQQQQDKNQMKRVRERKYSKQIYVWKREIEIELISTMYLKEKKKLLYIIYIYNMLHLEQIGAHRSHSIPYQNHTDTQVSPSINQPWYKVSRKREIKNKNRKMAIDDSRKRMNV